MATRRKKASKRKAPKKRTAKRRVKKKSRAKKPTLTTRVSALERKVKTIGVTPKVSTLPFRPRKKQSWNKDWSNVSVTPRSHQLSN